MDDTDRWYIVYDKGNYVMFSDKELPNPYEVVSAGIYCGHVIHSRDEPNLIFLLSIKLSLWCFIPHHINDNWSVANLMSSEYNGVELNHTSPPRFLRQNSVFKRDVSTEGVKVAHKTVEVVVVTDRSFWQQFDTRIEEVEEFALATIARMDQVCRVVVSD